MLVRYSPCFIPVDCSSLVELHEDEEPEQSLQGPTYGSVIKRRAGKMRNSDVLNVLSKWTFNVFILKVCDNFDQRRSHRNSTGAQCEGGHSRLQNNLHQPRERVDSRPPTVQQMQLR